MRVFNRAGLMLGLAVATLAFGFDIAVAEETYGIAVEKQMGFQPFVTEIGHRIQSFWDWILILITGITVFVLGLLIYVMLRYNKRANPVPSKNAHNTPIEIIWTVVPIVILIAIAIPSFRLLYYQDQVPEADLTIKAIGQQWYWDYEYPDHGDFAFTATMIPENELREGQPRLLATDNAVVLPVNKTVRVLVSADPVGVIHAWTVPAFGVKIDAVPGRTNELWFKVEREGTYYGQCSELCGAKHAFMPIEVKVVSDAEFALWIDTMQREYGVVDTEPATRLASAD